MPSAANSSLPSVGTAIRKSPAAIRRAASSRRWIWACSERETVSANAKAAISAAARIAMTSSAESLRPSSSRSASSRTCTRPAAKPGPSKPVMRSPRPPISTSPRSGRRSAPASGSVETIRLSPVLTTTSAPVTRSISVAYCWALMTETMSTPAVAPLASSSRVRAGATASPRPVSKRPLPRSVMTPRATSFSWASVSKRRWIGARRPAWIASASCGSRAITRAAASARSWYSRNSPEAARWASDSRASVLPCSESEASTNPTAATTIIGRMTRTRKKTVSRLRKLMGAAGDRPARPRHGYNRPDTGRP